MALHLLFDAYDAKLFDSFNATLFFRNWFDRSDSYLTGFLDDQNWLVEALLRGHEVLPPDSDLRQRCRDVSEMAMSDTLRNWDSSCCGSARGGIWWDRTHKYKAAASNFGAAVALCQLGRLEPAANWTQWATRAFDFWLDNMVQRSSGQVCDGITSNGTIRCDLNHDVYSYNQGMGLGAAACLDRRSDVGNIFKFLSVNETRDKVLVEHLGTPCRPDDDDCLSFLGITFRFLSEFGSANDILEASVKSIVKFETDEAFPNTWVGPALPVGTVVSLPSQTSALSAIINWSRIVCSR